MTSKKDNLFINIPDEIKRERERERDRDKQGERERSSILGSFCKWLQMTGLDHDKPGSQDLNSGLP